MNTLPLCRSSEAADPSSADNDRWEHMAADSTRTRAPSLNAGPYDNDGGGGDDDDGADAGGVSECCYLFVLLFGCADTLKGLLEVVEGELVLGSEGRVSVEPFRRLLVRQSRHHFRSANQRK